MTEVEVVKTLMAIGSIACIEGIIRLMRSIERMRKQTAAFREATRRLTGGS